MDDCIHGTNPDWCATCRQLDSTSSSGGAGLPWGGETKQDMLDQICDRLGIARMRVSVGSSVPSDVFDVIQRRLGLPPGSMPEVGESLAQRAGLTWSAECDSRGTVSGGGSTVTLDGLRVVLTALNKLL